MRYRTFNKPGAVIHRFLRRVVNDRRGLAATEFAMVVPILLGLYMGAIEFSQAVTIDRKLTSVASAATDLVAQTKSITQSEVEDIFNITNAIMEPYDRSSLKVTISSVVADSKNKQAVDWSVSNAGKEHSVGSKIPGMSAKATEANSSVIVAEVEYTYHSPVAYYFKGDTLLSDIFYSRPRKSLTVELKY